ncbi:MAG: ChbG/HpnK family deacetylase [Firmicutes bacterium]|nr:ChbG/HpnK family deacetylase [Bacillota bacterium]
MIRLIINADDFGLTQGVNRAIIQAHQCGALTSATLMANGLAWHQAVELAREHPRLGVGVHLTLTALAPVLPPEQLPSLVNREGRFRKNFLRLLVANKSQVRAEWHAQLSRLIGAGLKPTHVDSHHHVHLLPGLLPVAIDLAREFGIGAIRMISPRSMTLMGVGGIERLLASLSWRQSAMGLLRPDTVIGLETVAPEHLPRFIKELGPGVHEFFCHPGVHADHELENISSLTAKRVRELELLCSAQLAAAISQAQAGTYQILEGR